MNKQSGCVLVVIQAILVSACGTAVPAPAATVITRPISTSTPFFASPTAAPTFTQIPTQTSEPVISPGCAIVGAENQLYLLSDAEFRDFWSHKKEMDQAMSIHHPEWAAYTQMVSWDTAPVRLSEIINSASFDNELNLQINSKVALATLGMDLNWQLPVNADLFARSREISLKLNTLAMDWERPSSESLHAQYPEIANAATYAFYMYYDQDIDRLRSWCNLYQRLFEISP